MDGRTMRSRMTGTSTVSPRSFFTRNTTLVPGLPRMRSLLSWLVRPWVVTPSMASISSPFSSGVIRGTRADYANIETPRMKYGRFLNEADVAQERKVCVLGKKVYTTLFPEGGDPCGQRVRINGTYYNVIGVDWRESGGIEINGSADEIVTIPLSQAIRAYNLGNTIQMLAFTAKPIVAEDGGD